VGALHVYPESTSSYKSGVYIGMGANRFLKLWGLELERELFLKAPPVLIQAPPILGAWILTGGLTNIQALLKLGEGAWILTGGLKKF